MEARGPAVVVVGGGQVGEDPRAILRPRGSPIDHRSSRLSVTGEWPRRVAPDDAVDAEAELGPGDAHGW
jgi:hypothetical protein